MARHIWTPGRTVTLELTPLTRDQGVLIYENLSTLWNDFRPMQWHGLTIRQVGIDQGVVFVELEHETPEVQPLLAEEPITSVIVHYCRLDELELRLHRVEQLALIRQT